MTKQIEVLDSLPGSGKTYAILKYISEHKDFENYLSIHKPEFIDEFSIILAQRKLEQE